VKKVVQGMSNGIHSFINIIGNAGTGSVKIGRVLHPNSLLAFTRRQMII